MSNKPPRRRPVQRQVLPTAPSALVIADKKEGQALEGLLAAARLKPHWVVVDEQELDLEELLLEIEEGFDGPYRHASLTLVAADRLVDARLDLINVLDEVLDQRKPLLVSCTQATVAEQAALAQHPERIVGVGILGLLSEAKVVEISPSLRTDMRIVEQLRVTLQQGGYEARVVADIPGQVIGRLLAPMVNEAAAAVAAGVATAEDIDRAMRASGRLPFGPLEWADAVGLERVMLLLEHLSRNDDVMRYRPVPLLRELALCGFTGREAGRGFFTYDRKKTP